MTIAMNTKTVTKSWTILLTAVTTGVVFNNNDDQLHIRIVPTGAAAPTTVAPYFVVERFDERPFSFTESVDIYGQFVNDASGDVYVING